MSGKIKAKDLSYDNSLPPFLQRLKAQNAGHGDADRHENPIARPKRAKRDDDDDNDPTVVDETGETLSKEDVKKLTDPVAAGDGTENVRGDLQSDSPKASGALPSRTEHKLTDGTAQKKRKAAKVVGADGEQDDGKTEADAAKVVKKAKKKAKAKVNLSFNDDGD